MPLGQTDVQVLLSESAYVPLGQLEPTIQVLFP